MQDFIFKPFDEMTENDYELIGFKSGLEIHQQLLTGKKLFCRCPAGIYSHKFDAEILRHMRPTLSEMGEYDGTALMEFKTRKDIIYRINRNTVCTYEMDDTPPFEINDEALDIALQIGMMYNCSLIDEIHIARKQYLDGSIPTGFQRTAIVSVNGKIPYKDREINIIQLSIEEDSCREISDFGHTRIYITDRLGMPLVESVTAPEMKTPIEVMEVGEILRMIVRGTGKVRTGVGAGREDVNVSLTGGTRIEIKGVPSLKRIPLLTYHEAMRQWNLLRLREELNKRGITKETFSSKVDNITKLLKKTKYTPVKNAIESGMIVNCITLHGFNGLLRWKTQTDTHFSKEISDRIRVIACLNILPNMIHSDSLSESLNTPEWSNIKKYVGATDKDTIVIVWGSEKDVLTASNEIIIRAKEAAIGIPSETRQALRDGTNGFERILPGADRMYPDTDLPPKRITRDRVERLRKDMPELYYDRVKWYKELGIPEDVILPLSVSKYAPLFKKLVTEMNISPVLASVVLIQYPKRLKKKYRDISKLNADIYKKIFDAFCEKRISRDGILPMLHTALSNDDFSVDGFNDPTDVIALANEVFSNLKLRDEKNTRKLIVAGVMNKVRLFVDGKHVDDVVVKNFNIKNNLIENVQ